jgi:large subunit ribosomal protein L15
MQLHEIHPIHKLRKGKRVGRGGKHGTYSGKGAKGQCARSGRRFKPAIRELIKRYPKLRGYKFNVWRTGPAILNIEDLEKIFNANETVSPKILLERKLISNIKGKIPKVKILGRGNLTKQLTIEGCFVSKQAKDKIEKVSGIIK